MLRYVLVRACVRIVYSCRWRRPIDSNLQRHRAVFLWQHGSCLKGRSTNNCTLIALRR